MKTYCYHFPGMVYAQHAYGKNEIDARAWLREHLQMRRLPSGISFWVWTRYE